jgi:hypothetical protein
MYLNRTAFEAAGCADQSLSAYEYKVECWGMVGIIDGLLSGQLDMGANGTYGGHIDAEAGSSGRPGLNPCKTDTTRLDTTRLDSTRAAHVFVLNGWVHRVLWYVSVCLCDCLCDR